MNFSLPTSEIFVPDGTTPDVSLGRTTHLAIAAHQDDIEIMAFHGISQCFMGAGRHFTGVTVTNGAGSPRNGNYVSYSDEQMQAVRRVEQKKAAMVGGYSAQVFLDHPSGDVKNGNNRSGGK